MAQAEFGNIFRAYISLENNMCAGDEVYLSFKDRGVFFDKESGRRYI